MEWYLVILLFISFLLLLIFIGMPVAFAFLTVNVIVSIIFVGFESGMLNLINSTFDSVSKFSLTPIILFVLMGEVLFHSGLVMRVLDSMALWLGRIPSRLSILANAVGIIFGALSGSAVANTAMLGSALTPEMKKRGYHLTMISGPILAAGSLAIIIPPSTAIIIIGSLGRLSVGDLLIAGVVPGIVLGLMFIIYYIILGLIKPSLAPRYDVEAPSWGNKFRLLFLDTLPVCLLILVVLVSIFRGLATPTEAAAIGTLGAIILPIFYRKLTKEVILKSILGTLKVSGMILFIIAASAGYSQLLAYSGATRELINATIAWDVNPMITVIIMLVIVLILGMFIEGISIMMITVPLYIPVVLALGYDPIWFSILLLICIGIGNISPPFGLLLFIIKGVMSDVPMKAIYKSVVAIFIIQIVAIVIFMIFPEFITWLPSLGRTATG